MMTQYATVSESYLLMGTLVSIHIVGLEDRGASLAMEQAMATMRSVEEVMSRFDDISAIRRLCRTPGEWVSVPPVLFNALAIACEMARLTDGVFDPTIGRVMERQGFDRHYLTHKPAQSPMAFDPAGSFRDVLLNEEGHQVRLDRSLLLDLGAVAKGLAVDLAARAMPDCVGFSIDAGGDIYVSGKDPSGQKWHVGVEDPLSHDQLLGWVDVTNMAMCTSGSYKRKSPKNPSVHHLVDSRTHQSARGLLQCTVLGKQAVLADVMSTAGFLLGKDRALTFIEQMGFAGMIVTDDGKVLKTSLMEEYWNE